MNEFMFCVLCGVRQDRHLSKFCREELRPLLENDVSINSKQMHVWDTVPQSSLLQYANEFIIK